MPRTKLRKPAALQPGDLGAFLLRVGEIFTAECETAGEAAARIADLEALGVQFRKIVTDMHKLLEVCRALFFGDLG